MWDSAALSLSLFSDLANLHLSEEGGKEGSLYAD